jgi:hypothetical protein
MVCNPPPKTLSLLTITANNFMKIIIETKYFTLTNSNPTRQEDIN